MPALLVRFLESNTLMRKYYVSMCQRKLKRKLMSTCMSCRARPSASPRGCRAYSRLSSAAVDTLHADTDTKLKITSKLTDTDTLTHTVHCVGLLLVGLTA